MVVDTPAAHACGCLSPPVPIGDGAFAVNQSAEQIIFETEPGWVTAHVLIKYAGDPAKFAWIVPVPEVPTLGISPISAFGVLDKLTAPNVTVGLEDVCPTSEWSCAHHEALYCEGDGYGYPVSADAGFGATDAGAVGDPGITVISEQVVGDYQTVTFRASEASSAVQWLRDNGFIVNQTTSIYMESYIQANMVFVAAKLVPGAGVSSIKPLKMRYRAAYPTVPLILTAVAAQPHLTVNAFIYGSKLFRPQGHPIVTISSDRIATDRKGRTNYPMVLARAVDEAGGDGFAIEYRGWPVSFEDLGASMCCDTGYDRCNVGGNGKCECPRDEFDAADCAASQGDIVEGIALLDSLKAKYSSLTRITTRVSPEEMRFDPAFEPDFTAGTTGVLQLYATQTSLAKCEDRVLDKPTFDKIDALQLCAAAYCGPGGECTITNSGASCACGAGLVAQQFTDLDGKLSVTCVPEVPPVDLRAGGDVLPDACAGVTCGLGQCIDRNGIAVCKCDAGAAATTGGATPRCESIVFTSQSPGAQDFSDPLRALQVCAPPPPSCGADGWLVKTGSFRPGVDCGDTEPNPIQLIPPPKPKCPGFLGCGCQGSAPSGPLTFLVGGWAVFAILIRRRRRAR